MIAPDILLGTGYGPAVDMWATGVLLYILLSGRLPFHADNDAALFQLILEGKLVFKSPQFDTVSKEAQDLIKHLLVVDPDKRYNAKQALEHPFTKNYENVDEKPLHSSLYENLKQTSFLSRQRLKVCTSFLVAMFLYLLKLLFHYRNQMLKPTNGASWSGACTNQCIFINLCSMRTPVNKLYFLLKSCSIAPRVLLPRPCTQLTDRK